MTDFEARLLFAQTLMGGPEDHENENAWEAIRALRSDGDREVFDTAADWLKSEVPLKRTQGATILAQLRKIHTGAFDAEWLFRDVSVPLVVRMLDSETDPLVIAAGIAALGHLDDEIALPVIARYVNHPNREVRFSVTCALGCYPNDPLAVRGLLQLTRDAHSDTRDWAVFGLGVLGNRDSREIREALFTCLSDSDEDVREEAAVGLAKRRDARVYPFHLDHLSDPNIKIRIAEAATALLGLPRDPPEWGSSDYHNALRADRARRST